jgi:tetratricopeptide (TPR) repeat protein
MALTLRELSWVTFRRGDFEEAEKYAEESLTLCREFGDRQEIASTLNILGIVTIVRGMYEEAEQYFGESLRLCKEIGDRRMETRCLNNLGEIARKQGKYEEAARYYEKSLPIAREIGYQRGIAIRLSNLGCVYAELDEEDTAWRYLREALNASLSIRTLPLTLGTLIGVARLQAKTGRYIFAVELLGLILEHPATHAENKQEAELLLSMLHEALPASELEAALERGKLMDLDTIVAKILGEIANEQT